MSYLGFDYFSAVIVAEIQQSPWLISPDDVYDYAATQFQNYPAVVVQSSDLSGEFADNRRTKDTFGFSIYVLMNRLNQEQLAEQTMRGFVDDIVTRLTNNTNINGTDNSFAKPITVRWAYGTAPDPDMRVAMLTLDIVSTQDGTSGGAVIYTNDNKPILT